MGLNKCCLCGSPGCSLLGTFPGLLLRFFIVYVEQTEQSCACLSTRYLCCSGDDSWLAALASFGFDFKLLTPLCLFFDCPCDCTSNCNL